MPQNTQCMSCTSRTDDVGGGWGRADSMRGHVARRASIHSSRSASDAAWQYSMASEWTIWTAEHSHDNAAACGTDLKHPDGCMRRRRQCLNSRNVLGGNGPTHDTRLAALVALVVRECVCRQPEPPLLDVGAQRHSSLLLCALSKHALHHNAGVFKDRLGGKLIVIAEQLMHLIVAVLSGRCRLLKLILQINGVNYVPLTMCAQIMLPSRDRSAAGPQAS